ncbi:MAG: hypothetical protein U0326_38745 [Polyangiales bacterium]
MTRRARTALALSAALAADVARADPRAELLDRDAAHAELWWVSFTGVYTAAALVQTGLALGATNADDRVDQIVGAASAWLGVGSQLVLSPIPEVWRASTYARRTGRLDEALSRALRAESEARAWYNHAACTAVAIAAGATLWLGFDHVETAILNAASNLVIGELNLFTQPARVLRNAQRGGVAWRLAPMTNGVSWVAVW